jgi:hypothetical protein
MHPIRFRGLCGALILLRALPCTAAPIASPAITTTENWAGYVAKAPTGSSFTDVSSAWTVPTLQPTSAFAAYSDNWVGFGGVTNNFIEQCGTEALVTNKGQTFYSAWYEFYPAGQVTVSLTVNAGDTINADVAYNAAQSTTGNYAYTFTIADATTGSTYSNTLFTANNDPRANAEWIDEAPTVFFSVAPIANFGVSTFSNDVAALNGAADQPLGTLSDSEYEMIQTGTTVVPSPLSSDGESFSATYIPDPTLAGPLTLAWAIMIRLRRKHPPLSPV